MLSLLAKLSYVFAKIGLFTLGGGLAVIALVQQEMLSRGWLSHSEFLDILGIAQVTPGAMGVNAATFTGWRVVENAGGGFLLAFSGALLASIAVTLPSIAGVALAGTWFERNREKPWAKAVFGILRPVVAGAIFAVGANMVMAVFGAEGENGAKCIWHLDELKFSALPLVLCAGTFILTATHRFSPLWGLLAGAILPFIVGIFGI